MDADPARCEELESLKAIFCGEGEFELISRGDCGDCGDCGGTAADHSLSVRLAFDAHGVRVVLDAAMPVGPMNVVGHLYCPRQPVSTQLLTSCS